MSCFVNDAVVVSFGTRVTRRPDFEFFVLTLNFSDVGAIRLISSSM